MLKPLPPQQWDLTKAAHLLNRAAFGGTPEQIRELHALGVEKAVARMIDAPDDAARYPRPEWAKPFNQAEFRRSLHSLPEEERQMKIQAQRRESRQNGISMASDWLERMRTTANPLREKMTLFWHGHFATGMEKVRDPYLMLMQNETLRAGALGDFGALTKAISRDPAMMVYLDTNRSRRDKPNENFARELMELFTLGIGHYTEEDIGAAARAFTGYKIDPSDQTFQLQERQHDDGQKVFFGKKGAFDGDDVIGLILARPECAQFICAKLWAFFAAENPPPAVVQALAHRMRGAKNALRPVMRDLLLSADFYSPEAIRSQVKSPVQWLVQTARMLDAKLPRTPVLMNALRQMGQVPFAPPSVKGWDGGKSWITTSTLLYRYNLASFVVGHGPLPMQGGKGNRKTRNAPARTTIDFAKIAPPDLRQAPTKLLHTLCFRLYQASPGERELRSFAGYLEGRDNTDDRTIAGLLHLMMSTPQFQLT